MINLTRNSQTSKVLEIMRFPLAALIVFIHTSYSSDKSDTSYYIGNFISNSVANIAVPTFFFISGYLFFAKYENFGWKEYSSAIRKKFFSLAVPYFLWIAIVYYGMGVLTGFRNGPAPWDLYHIFWAESDGFVAESIFGYTFSILSSPAALGVLWFVRDLMVAILLTPVFWFIVKRLRMWSILFFLIPYFTFIAIPIQGFGLVALCFFPIGATFSICGKDIVNIVTGWGGWILGAFASVLIIKFGLDVSRIHYHRIIGQILIIIGIVSTVVIANYLSKYSRLANWICILGEASFFIYVGHALPVFIPLDKYVKILQSIPYFGYTFYYFTWWGFRIAIVVVLYFTLKRLCPKMLSVMVGGRIKSPSKEPIINDIKLQR